MEGLAFQQSPSIGFGVNTLYLRHAVGEDLPRDTRVMTWSFPSPDGLTLEADVSVRSEGALAGADDHFGYVNRELQGSLTERDRVVFTVAARGGSRIFVVQLALGNLPAGTLLTASASDAIATLPGRAYPSLTRLGSRFLVKTTDALFSLPGACP